MRGLKLVVGLPITIGTCASQRVSNRRLARVLVLASRCKSSVDDEVAMEQQVEDSLAALGLAPGATEAQIKEAYRDLTQVWHPDRFGHDTRLQRKAQEKLKTINGAYRNLRSKAFATKSHSPSSPTPSSPYPIKRRYVRMPLPHVEVSLGDRCAVLVDLSIEGAQLILDFAPPVDSYLIIPLRARSETLRLKARVVRISPVKPEGQSDSEPTHWTVGVTFADLSPQLQKAIPRFYTAMNASSHNRPSHARTKTDRRLK